MDDPQPPTKQSLLRWWKAFTRNDKHPSSAISSASEGRSKHTPKPSKSLPVYAQPGRGLERGTDGQGRVFGVSLEQSLQYASVAISMVNPEGKQEVYGYVPIVVAKCGMWLKEAATQTEGIFRVSGSNKRINQLQTVFDEPPRYGKDFDWTGYSVHDAASVLRRYLNSLPDPVIPAGLYLDFTAVLQQPQPIEASIAAYRELIALLPPASKYLLLYLLDFLSVFARSSQYNLMTASNLAVVFQPGLVSPRGAGSNALLGFPGFVDGKLPGSPGARQVGAQEQAGEHGRGKEVLEFLIEHQAAFMLDLEPPIDEERQKTKGVTAGPPSPRSLSQRGMPQPLFPPSQPLASTSAVPFDPAAPVPRAGGAALARRGSEKSVERRRLRKSQDVKDGGKVKRSKTWGSSTRRRRKDGEAREGSPSPAITPSASPQPPSVGAFSTPPPSTDSRPSHPPSHTPGTATLAPPIPPPSSSAPSSPASRSPRLGSREPSTKKPRKSADATRSPSPATSAEPIPVPPPATGGGGKGGGGGLLGFGRSKRRSLTPDGGAAIQAAAAEAALNVGR
ncbi:hypothetical protein JCM10213_005335 [Rhodosporidiobolus nylandii]